MEEKWVRALRNGMNKRPNNYGSSWLRKLGQDKETDGRDRRERHTGGTDGRDR